MYHSVCFSLIAISTFCGPAVFADPKSEDRNPKTYSLQELISLAIEDNGTITEGRWRVRGATARLDEAKAAGILPKLRLESSSGLVPDAEGDIFNPPSDTSGLRPVGAFNRTELQFVQPLFTFGYLRSLQDAASAGIEVQKSSLAGNEVALGLQVKELYYGLLTAQDLAEMVERLINELQEHQSSVSFDNPSIPLSGPYKLQLALFELKRRHHQALNQVILAQSALTWTVGLPEDTPLRLQAEWLEPVNTQIPELDTLFGLAVLHRPDWRKLRAGIAAKQALHDAAKKAFLPQVYLAGGIRYAIAPNRTDQHNPFVKDDFNYFNAGVFIGLRQSFEWGLLTADVNRARAELYELRAAEASATQSIRLDIKRAFLAYQQAEVELDLTREGRRVTREWLRTAKDEYELDPEQIKELVSAFEAFAQTEESYYQAMYKFNLTIARLEQTVGVTYSF